MSTATSTTRALLLVNRTAGTGHDEDLVLGLWDLMGDRYPTALTRVDDHRGAARAVEDFLRRHDRALVVVAGGGGTLRAVAEAAWRALGGRPAPPERLSIAALRLGSGNVVARALGAGPDPVRTLRRLADAHRAGRTTAVPLVRCREGGRELVGLAMAGFGRWGLVPGDIARWRRLAGPARRTLGRAVGIERVNQLEYRASFALRLAEAVVHPDRVAPMELVAGGRATRLRPLAAAAVNLPVRGLPGIRPPALSDPWCDLYVVPWPGRPRRPRLAGRLVLGGPSVRLRQADGTRAEWFLDEDPESFSELELDVPGCIHFVDGGASR